MSFDIKKVKIVVMVPEDYLEEVRMAALNMGAGVIGIYTHCSTSTKSIGTFIPSDHANPFLGEVGKMEYANEEKLEFVCDVFLVKEVLKKIREVHPYEEPGIDILPLLDEKNFK